MVSKNNLIKKGGSKSISFWYFAIATFILIVIGTVYSVLPNPGHPANEIGGNNDAERTFNGTAYENFTFPTNLYIKGDFGLNVTNKIQAAAFFGDGFNITRAGATFKGSTAPTNANIGGYESANALCNAVIFGSHVCNAAEIIDSIAYDNTTLPTAGDYWISSGPAKYAPAPIPVNDCNGWTHGLASLYLGSFWTFDVRGGIGKTGTCNNNFPVACCK